uniref:Uncharacterized protein n=1 Tax=Aegilops tauschii subsp. strangulata TaxID=200361 RepID=A0A453MUI6_AEGTS
IPTPHPSLRWRPPSPHPLSSQWPTSPSLQRPSIPNPLIAPPNLPRPCRLPLPLPLLSPRAATRSQILTLISCCRLIRASNLRNHLLCDSVCSPTMFSEIPCATTTMLCKIPALPNAQYLSCAVSIQILHMSPC